MPAIKEIYHSMDFKTVSELLNVRIQNVTTAQRTTLAATLNGTNVGLQVYDTDEKVTYVWDGVAFGTTKVAGAMVYRGTVTSLTTTPSNPMIGDTYVFTGTPGTLTWSGQTFSPTSAIEVGDILIYRGANTWDIVEGNDVAATETVSGNVLLATQTEVNTGTDPSKVVTSATLSGYVSSKKLAKTYFATANITALTPFSVTHNLALSNKDAFVVRIATSDGSEISVDVDSADANSFTITSSVSLTGIRIFAVGF
jgi:hypothetical protein